MPLITYEDYTDVARICPRCSEDMELHYTYHPRFTACITGGNWVCITGMDWVCVACLDEDEATIGESNE